MRRGAMTSWATRCLAALLAAFVAAAGVALSPRMAEAAGRRVVVSLGDSYSSGEGNPPFYGAEYAGADDSATDKLAEGSAEWLALEDYKAHRAELSWPGLLQLDSVTLRDSRYRDVGPGAKWYFYASSGAVAYNVFGDLSFDASGAKVNPSRGRQEKSGLQGDIRVQLDAAREEVDRDGSLNDVAYVTMTIGGNDMNFAGIVTEVAIRNGFVDRDYLLNAVNQAWLDYDESIKYMTPALPVMVATRQDGLALKRDLITICYERVCSAFGEDTEVIVAGYPTLMNDGKWRAMASSLNPLEGTFRFFDWAGSNVVGFADWEASIINENVREFNARLDSLVRECSARHGGRVRFVPVEGLFDGHEAYTDDPYINGLKLVDPKAPGVIDISYSFHPNERGIEAYRLAVQSAIDEIEAVSPPAMDGETAHAAYLEVIEERRSACGGPEVREAGGFWCVSGVSFATISDLDGDGTDELVLVWCDPSELEGSGYYRQDEAYHVEVWGYKDGEAVLLGDLGPDAITGSESGFSLAVGRWPGGGYVVRLPSGGRLVPGVDSVTSYWGLDGGGLRVLLSSVTKTGDDGRYWTEYYVDGVETDEAQFLHALGGGSAGYELERWQLVSNYGDDEDLNDTAQMTNFTIEQLQSEG